MKRALISSTIQILMFDPYKSLRAKAAFFKLNKMLPRIEAGDYESAAGIYNAGKASFRSSYTRNVANDTPHWFPVFSGLAPSVDTGGAGRTGGVSSIPSAYVIKSGDTLSAIAARFGVSLAALLSVNPQITNPNAIIAGESLNIPSQ